MSGRCNDLTDTFIEVSLQKQHQAFIPTSDKTNLSTRTYTIDIEYEAKEIRILKLDSFLVFELASGSLSRSESKLISV